MNDTTDDAVDVFPYLQLLYERGGSDLFFSVGAPPHMKVEGQSPAVGERVLQAGEVQRQAYQLMTQKQIMQFERDLEMNLAVSVQSAGRSRVNVYYLAKRRTDLSLKVKLQRGFGAEDGELKVLRDH